MCVIDKYYNVWFFLGKGLDEKWIILVIKSFIIWGWGDGLVEREFIV